MEPFWGTLKAEVIQMVRRLQTDKHFERAYLSHSTVYARERRSRDGVVGSLDGFNPLYVTVNGTKLPRDGFDFLTLR